MNAAIYLRISDDTEGLALGVARQLTECQKLCEQKGWTVADVYEDNDRSAFSGKRRPEYERLLDDVKNHVVDAIVSWGPDRLHRSPRQLEGFIDLVELTSVSVATVQAGIWDLTTPSGRLTARQLGSVARYESENKAARITAKHEQLREHGVPIGGAERGAFGYRWRRSTVGGWLCESGPMSGSSSERPLAGCCGERRSTRSSPTGTPEACPR